MISLIVALAIVAFIARTQLSSRAVAGTAVVPNRNATVASEAKGLQEKARADVGRALQEGARRNESADR